MQSRERIDTIVVGGGNAGLAAGYYLRERGADARRGLNPGAMM